MIEINLLPEELRTQKKKKEPLREVSASKLSLSLIAIIAIVIFVALQGLAAMALFYKKGSLERLEQQLKKLKPKYKTAKSLKTEKRELNSKLSAINELTSKSILWSKKMSDLSSAITEGVWLKELSLLDKKGPRKQQAMLLNGSVVSYPERNEAAIIGNFINSLKSNEDFFEDFEDIKLESSQMKKIADLDVMDFKIICYFKKGRSYFDKLKKY